MNKKRRKNSIKKQLGLEGKKMLLGTSVIREMLLSENDWYLAEIQGQLAGFFKQAKSIKKIAGKRNTEFEDLPEMLASIYDVMPQKNVALFLEALSLTEPTYCREFEFCLVADRIIDIFLERIFRWVHYDENSSVNLLISICGVVALYHNIEKDLEVFSFDFSKIEVVRKVAISLCEDDNEVLYALSSEQLATLMPVEIDDAFLDLVMMHLRYSNNSFLLQSYVFNYDELGKKLLEKVVEFSYLEDRRSFSELMMSWTRKPKVYVDNEEWPVEPFGPSLENYKEMMRLLISEVSVSCLNILISKDLVECAPKEVRSLIQELLVLRLTRLFPEILGFEGKLSSRDLGVYDEEKRGLLLVILHRFFWIFDSDELYDVNFSGNELIVSIRKINEFYHIDYPFIKT